MAKKKLGNPFVRVGCTYYKIIEKVDRYGFVTVEYKAWKKEELILDYNKEYVKQIPKYDDFVNFPDNINYAPVINNCLNLYSPFSHKPKEGSWEWTKILMEHVFGDQYELGIRYMQILYLHPRQLTVILALVSSERGTGKTTFINWLNMLFGPNMAVLSSHDFASQFNGYATKNIIAIEETFLEKKVTIEKLKAMATQKHIQINEKWAASYKVPFYGKIILTSNNEDKFAKIDKEEIRFFVRKLTTAKIENHNIEEELLKEIPAFLHHLTTLPDVDFSVSRSGFTVSELNNDALRAVVNESRTWLAKDLEMLLADFFENECNENEVYADCKDIKSKWYDRDNRVELNFIRTVLKYEFNLVPPTKNVRYVPFGDPGDSFAGKSKSSKAYLLKRDMFTDSVRNSDELPF